MKDHWKFHHTGLVVRDLEKAMENYRSLGVADHVSEIFVSEGKSAALRGCFLRMGSLNMEIWEPLRGNTVQQQFLDECGEGMNHIAFTTDRYDEDYVELTEKQGLSVIFGVKPPITDAGGGTYFDTRKPGHNVILELIAPSPKLRMPEWLA